MLDQYLERLRHIPPPRPLDGLEAGVWVRVAADEQILRSRTVIVGWQAAVVALLIGGSLALAGPFSAPVQATSSPLGAFSVDGIAAPSTLLLGQHR